MRFILLSFIICFSLVGCSKQSPSSLTIGTITGPESDLVEIAKDVAQSRDGLSIKIIEFNDYNLPNEALQDGSIDANIYQHLPYLQAAMKAHGYHFEVIGKTFIYPMAIYSEKYHTLSKLPNEAVIAIPNDPSNEARALLLLSKAGLITLNKNTNGTLADVRDNPTRLILKELDAAQLPRILQDVDAAVINTTFALPAGLRPSKDGLYVERKDSPYANLIVIREDNPKKQQLAAFVKAMNSSEVQLAAKNHFGDAAIPAW